MADPQIDFEPENTAAHLGFVPDPKPSVLQSVGNSIGNTVSHWWDQVNPVKAVVGLNEAVKNPVAAAKGYAQQNQDLAKRTADSFKSGDYIGAARHGVGYLLNGIPGVGAALDAAGNRVDQGDYSGALGDTLGVATNLAGPKMLKSAAAAKVGNAVTSGLSKVATETLGQTTGSGAVPIRQALTKPTPDLVNAMRGNTSEGQVLGHFKDALENVKDSRRADYLAAFSKLDQSVTLDPAPVRNTVMNGLKAHGVKVTPAGLDFSRSTIRDAAAQNEVKGIVHDVMNWGSQPGDLTPTGFDTLKRRIDDMYSPSSGARAFTQVAKNAVKDELTAQVPGYQTMTRGYAKASEFLDQLKDLSLDSTNPGTATRKLSTALKQNNDYRQVLTDALSAYTPSDLRGELAGVSLSRPGVRGVSGPISGGALFGALVTGALSPKMVAAFAIASPRLMGELMVAMSKTKPAAGYIQAGAVGALPRLAQAGQVANMATRPVGALPTAAQGGVPVTDPTGTVHTFPDQAKADAFKKAAGISN